MAKSNPVDILNQQRIELQNQLCDLDERRKRLTAILDSPLPEWDAEISARLIAKAEMFDRLNGSNSAAAIAAEQAKRREAYTIAHTARKDAQSALDSLSINEEVVKEELGRIVQELDSISTARAEKEFHAARAKLLDLAVALRDQAVIAGAWATLADQDPRPTPIRLPAYDATALPSGFWDSGRHFCEFGSLELQFAIEGKVMELRAAA